MKLHSKYEKIWVCHNPSKKLNEITNILEHYLKDYEYTIDRHNNIFIGDFSQSKPCLIAHLDSVHNKKSTKFYYKDGILASNNGIGGDDKCGIVAILELLEKNTDVNAIFCADEEIGGIGASNIEPKILKNVMYFIEIDREGAKDIIYESGANQIASDQFQKALNPFAEKYGYSEDFGTFTDVNILTGIAQKSAINISAGYYNSHTTKEYINLYELQNTINFVQDVIQNIRQTFSWEAKEYEYNKEDLSYLDTDIELEQLLEKAYLKGYDDDIIQMICKGYDIGYWEAQDDLIDQKLDKPIEAIDI